MSTTAKLKPFLNTMNRNQILVSTGQHRCVQRLCHAGAPPQQAPRPCYHTAKTQTTWRKTAAQQSNPNHFSTQRTARTKTRYWAAQGNTHRCMHACRDSVTLEPLLHTKKHRNVASAIPLVEGAGQTQWNGAALTDKNHATLHHRPTHLCSFGKHASTSLWSLVR